MTLAPQTQTARQCARIGWTQAELCRRLDISRETMRRWFNGTAKPKPEITAWLEANARAIEAVPALDKGNP